MDYFCTGIYWIFQLLWFAIIIVVVGSVIGAVLNLTGGLLLSVERTTVELLQQGAWIGFRWAGVWAIGLSLVLCIMKGYQKRK